MTNPKSSPLRLTFVGSVLTMGSVIFGLQSSAAEIDRRRNSYNVSYYGRPINLITGGS
jgi:hypothetical protein